MSFDEDGLVGGLQEIHSKYKESSTTNRPQGIDQNYKDGQWCQAHSLQKW